MDGIIPLALLSSRTKYNGKKIACLGDSITGNYDYPEKLGRILGATAYNCGFGGTRMIGGADANYTKFSMYNLATAIATSTWTDQDAAVSTLTGFAANLTTLKSLDFSDIDILVIGHGTNDFAGDTTIGSPDDVGTDTTFMGAINSVITTILTAFPNLNIFLVSPMWRQRFNPGDGVNSDIKFNSNRNYLIDFVNAMVEAGNIHKVPALNLYTSCGINLSNYETYLVDGLHPTMPIGTALLAEKISGFIDNSNGDISYSFNSALENSTKQLTNLNLRKVQVFDDFLYGTYTEANTPWVMQKGTGDGTALGVITANSAHGSLTFVTGANTGVYSSDGTQIASLPFTLGSYGGLLVEHFLRILTAITNVSICVGVTDTKNREEPFNISSGSFTSQDTGDTFTNVAHGLVDGDLVILRTLVTTTGVSINTNYYVVNKTADTFQVSLTYGGTAIEITNDGTGTYEAIHATASNAACLVFDSDAITKQWFAVAIKAGVIDYLSGSTGIAPIAGSNQKLRITTEDAATIKYYISAQNYLNESHLLKTLTTGVTNNVALFSIMTCNTTAGTPTAKTIVLDYINYIHNRP